MSKIIGSYLNRYQLVWQIPLLAITCYAIGLISAKSTKYSIIFTGFCFLSFFVFILVKTNTSISLPKFALYLTIAAAFIGPAFLTIDLGPLNIFMFRILLLFLCFIFIVQLLLNSGKINFTHIKIKYYVYFLIFWLLYSILSLAWADSSEEAIKDILFLLMGELLILFSIFYFNKLKDYKWFYYTWLSILPLMIGLGLWNSITGNHLNVSGIKDAADRFRYMPTAVFRNPNDFATYLVLSVPFIISYIKNKSLIIHKVLGLGLLLPVLYLIAMTKSRANYLALIVGACFWLLFTLKFKEKIKVLFVIFLLILLILPLFHHFLEPLYTLVETQFSSLSNRSSESGSINIRINLIKSSIILLYNHYGFGVGAGNIEYHMDNLGLYDTENVLNLHNWWMELLSNYGIIIFAGYILFYLSILYNLYKTHKKPNNNDEKMICEALLIGNVSFSIASISSSSIMAQGFHWVLFAFMLGYLNYHRLTKSGEMVSESSYSISHVSK